VADGRKLLAVKASQLETSIGRKKTILPTEPAFGAPLGEIPSEFCRDLLHHKSPWIIVQRSYRDPKFSRFIGPTIPVCECDRQMTDIQTHDDSICRASIASRG